MMMVDGNLKNRIRTLKLDVRYRTKVFGAGLTDYQDAAAWLAVRDGGAPTASA
jgi:hypothetical protein